jgi:hypothetical protein
MIFKRADQSSIIDAILDPKKASSSLVWNAIGRSFNRKPETLEDADKPRYTVRFNLLSKELQEFIKKLDIYDADEIFDGELYNDFKNPTDQFFIVKDKGRYFLINTEGYEYARYVARLENFNE